MTRGLFVAGVGRSGTSVATRLARNLGLRGPRPGDVMAPDDANPAGYWESESMRALDDQLLSALSATWWTPPPVVTSSMLDRLRMWRAHAASTFAEVFGDEPGWVFKDPRLTVLLPFWERVVGRQPVLVPFREPQAVAKSIAARDGLSYEEALAVWERHTRLLLGMLEGRRVLVAAYHDLLADAGRWTSGLREMCERAGVPVLDPAEPPASLVRTPNEDDRGEMTDEQRALQAHLHRLAGGHDRFPPVTLPPQSRGAGRLLAGVRPPAWARPPHGASGAAAAQIA